MIWHALAVVCFSLVAGITFEFTRELYSYLFPTFISRRKLLKKLDRLVMDENERLKDPTVYPSVRTSALQRVNTIILVKEIIKTL